MRGSKRERRPRSGSLASGYFDEGTRQRDVITTLVALVFDENTGEEKRQTFAVPVRKIGDLMFAKGFLH